MDKFLDLLQKSVITTFCVVVVLTVAICYLWCTGQQPDKALLYVWLVLLGISGGKLPEVIQALRK